MVLSHEMTHSPKPLLKINLRFMLLTSALQVYIQSNLNYCLRLCLVCVKPFPENILFSGNAIFRKGKRFHVFGCHKIHFTEN